MTETGDRAAFLATVADRLRHEPPPNLAHPIPAATGDVPRPVHVDLNPADLVGSFVAAAARVDACVHRVTAATLPTVLGQLVEAHGVARAVRTREAEVDAAADVLRVAGIDIVPYRPSSGEVADAGLTSAVAGIAATGSLVLDSSVAGGRGASLLPRVHLCVLPVDRLLPTTAELFRPLTGHPERLPSNLVLVTGPSRTGDIEQILTLGVHGPVAVEILLIGA